MRIGVTELLIVLAIVVLIFGPSQIPKLTRMFGQGVKSFKDGMEGSSEKDNTKTSEADAKTGDSQ